MKKLCLVLSFIILTACIYANEMIETQKGNFIYGVNVTEFDLERPIWSDIKSDFKGDTDIYLVEFNPQGEVQRKVLFGGAGEECIVKLLEDKDGYIYLIGTAWEETFGSGDFAKLKSHGNRDCFIAKLNSELKTLKVVNFGTKDYDFTEDFILTDKGFCVVGRTFYSDNTEVAFVRLFDKDLNTQAQTEFKGSFNKPGDATATSFASVCLSDTGNYVCCGSASTESESDATIGILVEFDKNLEIVRKASIKEGPLSFTLHKVMTNEEGYLVAGNATPSETPVGFFTAFTKDFDFINRLTYTPESPSQGEYFVYCSFQNILKTTPIVVVGFAGEYKGNGDYEDDFFHNFYIPYDKELKIKNVVKLPKDTSATINTKNNTLMSVVEEKDKFKLVETKL